MTATRSREETMPTPSQTAVGPSSSWPPPSPVVMSKFTFVTVISVLFIVLLLLHLSFNIVQLCQWLNFSWKEWLCTCSFVCFTQYYVDESYSLLQYYLILQLLQVTVVHSFSLQECCPISVYSQMLMGIWTLPGVVQTFSRTWWVRVWSEQILRSRAAGLQGMCIFFFTRSPDVLFNSENVSQGNSAVTPQHCLG